MSECSTLQAEPSGAKEAPSLATAKDSSDSAKTTRFIRFRSKHRKAKVPPTHSLIKTAP